MRLSLSLLASALFAANGVVAAPRPSYVLHEKRDAAPRQWIKRHELDPNTNLPVRIGLTQQNLHKGHDWLMEVSEHDSPKYGQHYTAEEVHDMFAPAEAAVDAVRGWLHDAGIEPERISQSVNKQWLQLDATAKELGDLLQTEYYAWEHAPSGKSHVACDEYSIPAHIQEHVDYVTPGIKLVAIGSRKMQAPPTFEIDHKDKRTVIRKLKDGSMLALPPILSPLPLPLDQLLALPLSLLCGVAITPACVKALYKVPDPTKKVPGNDLGIFEDLGDTYAQEDLTLFFTTLADNIPSNTHPKLKSVDGATAPNPVTSGGVESALDFELAYPLLYPQGIKLFQTDDDVYQNNYNYSGFLNNFLDAIDGSYCTYKGGNSPLDPPYPHKVAGGYKGKLECGVYKPTNVISISYGGQEADLPAFYQKRQCHEYMKLGLQGVSVVVASGDSGVAGPMGDDSANGCLKGGKVFSPDFPATCPYITTLGATTLPPTGQAGTTPETSTTQFPSGGGFSNIFPIPKYQSAAVNTFFTKHNPPYKFYKTLNAKNIGANGGIYNRIGRGYPDFSANGQNVLIFADGMPNLVGGTSSATPIFASLLTRINGERISKGKSSIGFVNPVLYAHPEVFTDVTTGTNAGCGTNGFSAVKGWDPLSGLGTPRYPEMLKLYMSLN